MGDKKKMMWVYMLQLGTNMFGDDPTNQYYPYNPGIMIDEKVWRQTIDFLPAQGFNTVLVDVADAVQYERHPEISIEGAWSKDKLKKELDYMRSLGLTPIPKLNFSAAHDAWLGEYSRMLATPKYYEVCRDVITEVAEVFDYPEYFHLGMDEENPENQVRKMFLCVRQHDLLWHDMYFLFDVCEKLGMRPWVWSDLCWNEKMTKEYMKRMPKSVLQSNWWYRGAEKDSEGKYLSKSFEAYRWLEREGFDQVPTCSTCFGYDKSALETMRELKVEIAPERLKGYMTAPWGGGPRPNNQYRLMNDALKFYVAKKEYYPEECGGQ